MYFFDNWTIFRRLRMVRILNILYILFSRFISHYRVYFFDIIIPKNDPNIFFAFSKNYPKRVYFNSFYFKLRFAPGPFFFRYLNFQKLSGPEGIIFFFTSKYVSHYNDVHLFNILISKNYPNMRYFIIF